MSTSSRSSSSSSSSSTTMTPITMPYPSDAYIARVVQTIAAKKAAVQKANHEAVQAMIQPALQVANQEENQDNNLDNNQDNQDTALEAQAADKLLHAFMGKRQKKNTSHVHRQAKKKPMIGSRKRLIRIMKKMANATKKNNKNKSTGVVRYSAGATDVKPE